MSLISDESMNNFGYIKSSLKGNEIEWDPIIRFNLFDHYNLSPVLDPVRDQGSVPKCVSVALTDMVRYRMKVGYTSAFNFSDDIFFRNRQNKDMDGMQPIEAFEFLSEVGVSQGILNYKNPYFGKINSVIVAKYSIITNGPLMICLPVRSMRNDFWNGNENYGGHTVTLVGYDSRGFNLRNSWGISYGNGGYWTLPYSDFNKAFECWTLI